MMNVFAILQTAPPEPFTFGATGALAAIGFVLFELAVAAGFYFVFRNLIRKEIRAIISAFLILLALAGGVYIWTITAQYDRAVRARFEEKTTKQNSNSSLTSPAR